MAIAQLGSGAGQGHGPEFETSSNRTLGRNNSVE
jgi:hypothetical protein